MKKHIALFSVVLLILGIFTACETLQTPEQDTSPLGTMDHYPNVTITSDKTGTNFKEGDVITYTVKYDRPIDRSITFTLNQLDGTLSPEDYETNGSVIVQPYTTEGKITVKILKDNIPEGAESGNFEVGAYSRAEKNLISTTSPNPVPFSMNVTNVNNPDALTITMEWPDHDIDYDLVIWSDNPLAEFGDAGATGNNPEIDMSIETTAPDGVYYASVMDWGEPSFNYVIHVGHPDGKVETITGTFDRNKQKMDPWTAWGDSYESYRVLKVVKNGSTFTVTKL